MLFIENGPKIKCSEVDYINFDPSNDKNLNQGMGEGMKLLMEKFRSQVAKKQAQTKSLKKDEL